MPTAAHAISGDLPQVTNNEKEFQRIDRLIKALLRMFDHPDNRFGQHLGRIDGGNGQVSP